MINMIKAEFIKERRAANSKLRFIVPIIFVVFSVLMVNLIGESPSGRSYIVATSFNWYPVMILPIVLSLLVINIASKEKQEHIFFLRSTDLSVGNSLIAKNIVVLFELIIILILSSVAIYFVGTVIFHDNISAKMLIIATLCLFIGSLPIIAISFLVYQVINKRFLIVLMNFLLTFISAIIAPTANWKFLPWAYSLRIICPITLVHPNGTFLETGSPLIDINTTYFGLGLSIVVYVFVIVATLFIESRKKDV